MPKVSGKDGRIAVSQRQRQLIAKKSEKFGASTVYLQVLGSGARGAPNTLYLFTDQKRYLFNCGEGTQRLAHEHKVKLSKLEQIFITNKTWNNIGGLPGLSLTLQDVGVPNITLHGPEGLDELYKATKRFVIMKEMNVTMAQCSPSVDFEDNVMTVKYVLMAPQDNILQTDLDPVAKKAKLRDDSSDREFEEFIHDNTDYYKRDGKPGFNKKNNTNVKPKSTVGNDGINSKDQKVLHDLKKHNHCTVAYICILKKRLGTLDLEKCVEFGVKPGPMLGMLKNGQDVVLPDGTLVQSKNVKTPDDPGPVFIVMEVPDLSYLKELEFSAHFDNGANPPENIPTVIVHYTPPHVFNHPTYRAFLAMFGPTTRHLVLNRQNSCLGSESVHRTQHKLHLLDGEMFPLLRDTSMPALWDTPTVEDNQEVPSNPVKMKVLEELKQNIALAQFQNIINMEGSCAGNEGLKDSDSLARLELIAGRTLTIFHLRPKKQLDRSVEPKLHIQEYIQEPLEVEGFVGSLERFRKVVEDTRYAKRDSQKEYPKVVFMGTGSCIPSKTRNTSGIVVHISEDRSMLLDCGEGTFGQLVRFYGPKKVNSFLRTLKAIYVSHLHADHHIGLIGVLQARHDAFAEINPEGPTPPLYLLAPGQIVTWLSIYHQLFEKIREEFVLVPNQNLLKNKQSDLSSAILSEIGVQSITTCQVAHCPNAFGVTVSLDHDHSVTYSGDTIPCDELVVIGKDSTLLIHEATMEDELADEARTKMHSTTSQAINIGKKMNAKYTVLTHFSQRYARLPRLSAHILNDNNSVGIAFDNMQITMSDLELLPHMYAPLQLMFADHCVELELKAEHRARQKEKKPSPAKIPSSGSPKQSLCKTEAPPIIKDKDKHSPVRKRSPSCGKRTPSCDRQSMQNRDNVCSRLRQERSSRLAAKAISGERSKSCSPIKYSSRNSSPFSTKCGSAPHSPTRSPETIPHRTASQSLEVSKNTKIISQKVTDPVYVVDTRSKTLNKAPISTASYTIQMKNINTKTKILDDRKQNSGIIPSKQLGDNHQFPSVPANKRRLSQSRSLNVSILDIITSILYHILLWKLHSLVSYISYFEWQLVVTVIAVGYLFWTANKATPVNDKAVTQSALYVRATCPDVNSIPMAKSKRLPQIRTMSTIPPTKKTAQDQRNLTSYNNPNSTRVAFTRDTNNWNTGQATAVTRQSIKNRMSPIKKRAKENIVKAQATVKSASSSRESSKTFVLKKENKSPSPTNTNMNSTVKSASSSRESSVDRKTNALKRENKYPPPANRNYSKYSSKNFKPQLEDIKSSFLLLNKKKVLNNKNIENQDHNATKKVLKPQLSETERKKKLVEAMNKFKTKKYWHDSKYERIEGLNWISWK